MSASIIRYVRHGEVENPDGVVYASLPGFPLSERGRSQAEMAADYLAADPPAVLLSSPLQRAAETAGIIAARLGVDVVEDTRLAEWALAERWAGVRWEELDERFPGEVEAYLAHPRSLSFTPESLDELAARVVAAVYDAMQSASGPVVAVSHQDPIQAARLRLVGDAGPGAPPEKPGHASVVTLARGNDGWVERSYWEPPQGAGFPPREG